MRRFTKHIAALLLVGCVVAVAGVALAATQAKKYQVTGVITAVSDQVITVQKSNEEKWEINRDETTKTTSYFKVGDKVTIEYRMVATSIEVK